MQYYLLSKHSSRWVEYTVGSSIWDWFCNNLCAFLSKSFKKILTRLFICSSRTYKNGKQSMHLDQKCHHIHIDLQLRTCNYSIAKKIKKSNIRLEKSRMAIIRWWEMRKQSWDSPGFHPFQTGKQLFYCQSHNQSSDESAEKKLVK